MKHIRTFDGFVNEAAQLQPMEDLETNYSSWKKGDHNNAEDADQLASILMERHPNANKEQITKMAYDWVGYDPNDETIS